MIDTDKMKAAFAATPLCQNAWTVKGDGGAPTKLCAISALVSFAGVQPALIALMQATENTHTYAFTPSGHIAVPGWVGTLALPVLRAEYSIPEHVAIMFPGIFDKQENELRGVVEVLALCERHNQDELHAEAIREDWTHFPQPTQLTYTTFGAGFSSYDFSVALAPKKAKKLPPAQKAGQSKFWTSSTTIPVPKEYAGKLITV